MQVHLHHPADALDVDAAVRGQARAALEDSDGADVHVAHAVLDREEAVVQRGEALEVGIGHGRPQSTSGGGSAATRYSN